jgi:mono/diheme cytochrome c family protein
MWRYMLARFHRRISSVLSMPLWPVVCGVLLIGGTAAAQSGARPGYDVDFIGPPLADPVMQYNKESYVTYGCAYCHGVDLVPRGEAADLRQSAVVGADVDGSAIVRVLRAGIPKTSKLSPMPQYSDLSDQQLNAIAAWIHYARRRDRVTSLTRAVLPPGNAAAGRTYFERMCSSCHASADLAGLGKKYDPAMLRAQILEPAALASEASFKVDRLRDSRMAEARTRHHALLENYSAGQIADLLAYAQGLK